MIHFAFFLSGAAALLYEILWVRIVTLLCGHTSLAVSAVLAAFMAGLALGSRFGGQGADRLPPAKLLRLYCGLEAAIALFGLVTKPMLVTGATLLLRAGILELPPAAQAAAYFAATFMILLPATICMGATLPVLIRWRSVRGRSGDRPLAVFYGVNTLGAVVGAAVAGFVLLPLLGTTATLLCAAAANAVSAALAYRTGKNETASPPPGHVKVRSRLKTLPVCLLAATGAAAMLCQVAWTRAFALLLGSTTYAFTIMLTTFLLGLSLGSLAFAVLRERLKPTLPRLALLLTGVAACILAGLRFFEGLTYVLLRLYVVTFLEPDLIFFVQFALCGAVMAVPTFLMGAILPWAVAAARPGTRSIGGGTGGYYAANTAGAIAGSAAAGLWLLPSWGVERTLIAAAALYGAAAFAAAHDSPAALRRVTPVLGLLAVAAGWCAAWNPQVLSSGVHVYAPFFHATGRLDYAGYRAAIDADRVIYFKNGRNATVAVHETRWGARYMRINGKTDASESGDMGTQLLIGHLPLLLRSGTPRDALAVGFGSGMTAGALASDPRLRRIDALEIEPAVAQAARFFERANHGVLDDPRLRLTYADARQFMAAPGRRYDIISSEPSNPWIAGIASLFTREAFADVRRRLADDGIFCQWFHSYYTTEEDFRMVMRTFADVFPHVMLFSNGEADYILMGSPAPWRADFAAVRRAYRENATMRGDFERLRRGMDDPFTLLARSFILGGADYRKYAGAGPLHTDDRTRLEFSGPRNFHIHDSDKILQNLTRAKTTMMPDGLSGIEGSKRDWSRLYSMTGENALRAEDIEQARESFLKAKELDAFSGRAWTGLGRLHEASGDDARARDAYTKAIALEPSYPHAHARLGALLAGQGKDQEALEHLRTALKIRPEDPLANLAAARVSLKRGEKDTARKLLRAALGRPVPDEELLKGLVEIQRALD